MGRCFGIDLGTTCSSIAVVEEGVPRLIPLDGDVFMPSVVQFTSGEPVPRVGHTALSSIAMEPERTIRSSKRYMGSEHCWDLGDRRVTAPEVAAIVLRQIADLCEKSCGERPERVVITVPAWFTNAQRSDTKNAAANAGLDLVRMINEPTAAALAHAHGQPQNRRVLVYDLGGGTFDVSLVEQDGPIVEVKASHGDTRLGGDDVDEALLAVVLERLRVDDPSLHEAVQREPSAKVRLRIAVEEAKIALSAGVTTVIRVPFLCEGARHLEMGLARVDLDDAVEPLLERTFTSVDEVLKDANLTESDIDELLLVGGSTLLPQVWTELQARYGLEGSHAIPPRTAVALGAAIQAAIIDGSRVDGILVDVAPYALSAGVATGFPGFAERFVCRVLTPRNSPLPSRHTEIFHTLSPYQREIRVPVFQGSHIDPRRNVMLGEVSIDRLDRPPAGHANRPIAAEFRHNLDGMVQITVTDQISGRSSTGTVAADGLSQADLWTNCVKHIEEIGLSWGDGTEELEAPTVALAEPRKQGVQTILDGDSAEAARTFGVVLAARPRLIASHPAEAESLLELARTGLQALELGETSEALEHYDRLADQLFSLGLYL